MTEHALIKKHFAPLAAGFPGSLNLTDDAAILEIPEGYDLVVTKDAISEGVHFLKGTDAGLVAQKLLRTNLSDLAAMGAAPLCYFLSLSLPELSEDYISHFARGLAEDQKTFGIYLAGGDTTATHGTPTFSVTAHGLVKKGRALRRNGAKAGDGIYVTGTLGDAALGLILAKDGKSGALVNRYHLPQPRLKESEQLIGLATSCIDISDGLLADMQHVCDASSVGAEISLEALPVSKEAREMIAAQPELLALIYSGGDDYELLFTLPAGTVPPFAATKIGTITSGRQVTLMGGGKEIRVAKKGYAH